MSSEDSYDGLPTSDASTKGVKDAPPAYEPSFDLPYNTTAISNPQLGPQQYQSPPLPAYNPDPSIELQTQPPRPLVSSTNPITNHFSPRPAPEHLAMPISLRESVVQYPTATPAAAYPPIQQPTMFDSPAAAPLLPDNNTPFVNTSIAAVQVIPLDPSWEKRLWSYVSGPDAFHRAQADALSIPLTAYNPGDPLNGPMLDLGALTSKYPVPLNHAISTQEQEQFPQSAALYRQMVAVVGARNVIPPPAWLDQDEFRVWWLKSDFNALPYFLTISPEVKQELQGLLDKGMCVSCCSGSPLTSASQNCCGITPCSYFWLEMCCFPFGGWYTIDDQAAFYMPRAPNPFVKITYNNKGQAQKSTITFATSVCCFCDSTALAWRKYVVQTWQAAGLTYEESPSAACWKTTCCKPCISAQHAEIAMHYYARRYGPALLFDPQRSTESRIRNPEMPMMNGNNALTRYLDDTRMATQQSSQLGFHPYSTKETTESTFLSWIRTPLPVHDDPGLHLSTEDVIDRSLRFNWFDRCAGPQSSKLRPGHESQPRYWYSPLPAFAEWLDLPSALREHHRRWFRFGFLEL